MSIDIPIISSFSDGGIKSAIKSFQQLETSSQKAQFAIKKAALPAAAALAGLAAAGYQTAKAASDFNETINKSKVIFFGTLDSVLGSGPVKKNIKKFD